MPFHPGQADFGEDRLVLGIFLVEPLLRILRVGVSATAVANGAGRFGAKDAQAYLASPASVAAAAVTGRITDPRTLLHS